MPSLYASTSLEADTPMRADKAEGYLPIVEQPDQEGSGDVEEIGGLLCGQLRILSNHRDGAAGRHVRQNRREEPDRAGGQLDGLLPAGVADFHQEGSAPLRQRRQTLTRHPRQFDLLRWRRRNGGECCRGHGELLSRPPTLFQYGRLDLQMQ